MLSCYCTLDISCAKLLFLFEIAKLFYVKIDKKEKTWVKICIVRKKVVPLHPLKR
jgi:hypothetical protein